jgi:hypothetical protein
MFAKEELYEALKEHALSAEKKGSIARPIPFEGSQDRTLTSDGCCIVEGSGTPECHGVYVKSKNRVYGVTAYIMRGRFMNKRVTFILLQQADKMGTKRCGG